MAWRAWARERAASRWTGDVPEEAPQLGWSVKCALESNLELCLQYADYGLLCSAIGGHGWVVEGMDFGNIVLL
jgi:hypothetical protein